MSHPYLDQPERAFWKTAVASRAPTEMVELWQPRFPIAPDDRVVTFGSCFAQHFSRALTARGFSWFNAEPAPDFLPPESARRFNFGIFSARTGNVYSAAALRQWLAWAAGTEQPPEEAWERDGRFHDPFRPAIEPDGFESPAEMLRSRQATIAAVRRAAQKGSVFVFTMGLTEAWEHRAAGHVYAACPGTVAGRFDPDSHVFANHGFERVLADTRAAIALLRGMNPEIRVLLTVSPVPLTATATCEHVLIATTYSKSVLRGVAGALAAEEDGVDYFPSYEIITAPAFGGAFFAENMRSVRQEGVDFVMQCFFDCQQGGFGAPADLPPAATHRGGGRRMPEESDQDIVCEEEMLEAFARGGEERTSR